jgi:hypothetical protein
MLHFGVMLHLLEVTSSKMQMSAALIVSSEYLKATPSALQRHIRGSGQGSHVNHTRSSRSGRRF